METIVEKLKEYFDNTPREKVLEDWDKSKEWDKIGTTVDQFIKDQQDIEPDIQTTVNEIYWGLIDDNDNKQLKNI